MSIYGELACVFFISVAISALYTWTKTDESFSENAQEVSYKYLIFSGTFLALLLSFTVTIVWQSYIDLNRKISDQAADLRRFYYNIENLPDSEPIIDKLEQYLDSIANDQWKASRYQHISEKTSKTNRELADMIKSYKLTHAKTSQILDIDVDLANQLEELSISGVNSFLILIIMIVSIIFLILLWFIRFDDIRIQYIFNLGTIFIIGLMLYFMVILNQPFTEHAFQVKPTEYIKLRDKISQNKR